MLSTHNRINGQMAALFSRNTIKFNLAECVITNGPTAWCRSSIGNDAILGFEFRLSLVLQ